jgi:hypothetical protein
MTDVVEYMETITLGPDSLWRQVVIKVMFKVGWAGRLKELVSSRTNVVISLLLITTYFSALQNTLPSIISITR